MREAGRQPPARRGVYERMVTNVSPLAFKAGDLGLALARQLVASKQIAHVVNSKTGRMRNTLIDAVAPQKGTDNTEILVDIAGCRFRVTVHEEAT